MSLRSKRLDSIILIKIIRAIIIPLPCTIHRHSPSFNLYTSKNIAKKKKGRRTNKKLPQSSIREIFTSMRRTVNTLLLLFLEIHHRPEKRNSTTRFFTVYPDPLSLERFVPKTATTPKWCAAEGVVRSGRASLGSHPRA